MGHDGFGCAIVERVQRIVFHLAAARGDGAAPCGMLARRGADGSLVELWLKDGERWAEYEARLLGSKGCIFNSSSACADGERPSGFSTKSQGSIGKVSGEMRR